MIVSEKCMIAWLDSEISKIGTPKNLYLVSQKRLTRLVGYGMKSLWLIFKAENVHLSVKG